MANRLYNKQVSPKGYKKGGRVAKMGGGMMMKRSMMKEGGPTFNYDEKHPKVQSLKKFINKNRKEKNLFRKEPMTDKEAKKLADRLETRTSKRVSKTEGSFKKGGEVLKSVDKNKNPGLAKLPTDVRNKMGFMKDGGKVNSDKLFSGPRQVKKPETKLSPELSKKIKKALKQKTLSRKR